MSLSNETVVAIISLLIMSLPVLGVFIRLFRRRNARTLIPLELVPGPDDLASLENGMLYARRTIRVDTIVIRPAIMPYLHWPFRRRGSELEATQT
ncbi:hypothetical protein F4820DRAFT_446720 [Hypoxylon rubiginosum]|uniref:Uncharacterized protein n=1 Tax=Hypoxylon rubiginosum TaxID=110542 RepID=A0ACB9Z5V5_9PEZI|nr:hypothetical protein F4820DRAFT_446720 [Hypoxylon rubiginosum]